MLSIRIAGDVLQQFINYRFKLALEGERQPLDCGWRSLQLSHTALMHIFFGCLTGYSL